MTKQKMERPTLEQLDKELQRRSRKKEYSRTMRGTMYILITVAAVAVLVATIFLPILQVYGSSMEPTLENGELVLATKMGEFRRGEVVAFYYNNKILLKRVIALQGDQIVIREDGTVLVNGDELDEPYLFEKSLGECDLEFPYQIPDNRIFVMGDHRSTSVDSRSSAIGCISDEFVVGKVWLRFWPFDRVGTIS
ncbi:signal peptidase I [Clostridium sp. D33t1_170424_F3]|uniref:signal peptidase I n=1 Tax=Clostridium sp. D33t1_170424_F3 TaxID=2787099 RepID=UPI0018AC359B|nr:signal peptidase I [Clostridium sp. D33t1_170424_F3]